MPELMALLSFCNNTLSLYPLPTLELHISHAFSAFHDVTVNGHTQGQFIYTCMGHRISSYRKRPRVWRMELSGYLKRNSALLSFIIFTTTPIRSYSTDVTSPALIITQVSAGCNVMGVRRSLDINVGILVSENLGLE
jgi:hypothetical protein